MPRSVKPTRSYDSTGRQAQAQANRRRVIASATKLFLQQGYGRATVASIAADAGVSAETIYATFGTKADLLHRVWDVTIGGDDDDVVFHERAEIQALMAEPDLRARLVAHARLFTSTARRISPFLTMLQAAAGAEPVAAEMLEEVGRQRLVGMTVMAASASDTGQLAVSDAECRDLMWATTDGMLWHRLVHQRGWSDEQFAAHLARLWIGVLLG